MTEIIDAEVVEDTNPPSSSLVEYRPQMVLSVEEAGDMARRMHEVVRAVLTPEVDYGRIPGTPKPSLLKPGAEKLLQLYGLGHSFDRLELDRDDGGKPYAVTYRCTVTRSLPDREVVVSSADAYAGRDEPKWAKAPFHTIIAMAQKRALVNAALRATAASGLFTSDMEDHADPVSFGSVVQAHIDGDLDDAGRAALKDWWRDHRLPRVVDLKTDQAAAVLVQIGKLSSGREVAKEATSGVEDDRAKGETGSPEPATNSKTDYDRRRAAANAALAEAGIRDAEARHAAVHAATGGATASTGELTEDQMRQVRDYAHKVKAERRP